MGQFFHSRTQKTDRIFLKMLSWMYSRVKATGKLLSSLSSSSSSSSSRTGPMLEHSRFHGSFAIVHDPELVSMPCADRCWVHADLSQWFASMTVGVSREDASWNNCTQCSRMVHPRIWPGNMYITKSRRNLLYMALYNPVQPYQTRAAQGVGYR